MRRLLPDSLSGRLIGLLLLALALAQIAALLVFSHERGRALEQAARNQVQNRLVSTAGLLAETPVASRKQVLRRAQSRGIRLFLTARPRRLGPPETSAEQSFESILREELGNSVGRIHVRLRSGEDARRPFIAAAVELPDGPWLVALKAIREPPPRWSPASLLALLLSAVFVVLAVIIGVRGITASLGQLSNAADRLGRGEDVPALPETGPTDLRRTARAFNQMRERLQLFVSDRTRMLAAVSHDLRTPITALRLRAEFIDDEENRRRILEILDEMHQMTDATLDFARSDSKAEPTETVELTALLDAVADDYRGMGRDVQYTPGPAQVLRCRRVSLKRALQNLVNNALEYGEKAVLSIRLDQEDHIEIVVADAGPGIPESEQARVFDPFVRLEESRNQDTGGIGLGLSIARGIARAHGGDVVMHHHDNNDFEVVIRLPSR